MKHIASRLVIADPSLIDSRGHHYSLTLQISRGAYELGIETIWLTHKNFEINELAKYVEVIPVFSMTMYDRYKPELKNELPENKEYIFFDELKQGILKAKLGREDHVFFHTAFGDIYRTLPLYLSSSNVENLPYLHLCTPYEPEIMPGRDPGDAVINVLHAMKDTRAVDEKLFFWAETPQLALDYTFTYSFNVRSLPLPPPSANLHRNNVIHSDVFVALYLGAAREEKGFLLLPEIVKGLYESHGKTGKLKFVIQCSPQIIGYIPSIKEAIDRLSQYPEYYVTLIKNVLSENNYYRYLLEANVLLLLYDKNNYRIRGSGIAVEAISTGKCILTFKNTFCESLISFGGGEAVENIDEAIFKLAKMIDNKDDYILKAQEQCINYRRVNSVENYVSRVVNQPKKNDKPKFFPSNVMGTIRKSLLKI